MLKNKNNFKIVNSFLFIFRPGTFQSTLVYVISELHSVEGQLNLPVHLQ